MYRYLLAFWLAAALPAVVLAQSPTQTQAPAAEVWARAGGRVTFTPARISFPERAGAMSLYEAGEASRRGEGLDNVLQYRTADGEAFATVYVYYPGLAHAGLTAFATDNAIRLSSGDDLRLLNSAVVSAGGREAAAIRRDYAGVRQDRWASSAAFIKSGRWIIKLRVSGPESRRAEVERAMAALLDEMRFEGEIIPRAAEPLEVGECSESSIPQADLIPSGTADSLEEAIIGVLDGSGDNGREDAAQHRAATPILGRRWCLSTRGRIGDSIVPVLRAPAANADDNHRSAIIAIISDSGTLVEVVRTPQSRFVVLYHEIGRTRLLGTFASVPTDQQIMDILSGSDRAGGTIRATITHKRDGNTDITVNDRAQQPAQEPST